MSNAIHGTRVGPQHLPLGGSWWKGPGLLLMASLLWTLACGSTPTATNVPDPSPTPTPLEVMEESSSKMIRLNTASFHLEDQGETSARFFGLKFESLDGQVRMPDSFKVQVEATSFLGFIKIEIVAVGDQAVISDFINKEKWNPIAVDDLPFNFANLGNNLAEIIPGIMDPAFAGEEGLDGQMSWRIRGTVPSEGLSPLLPGTAPGRQVGLELWIDQEQMVLRKIRIEGEIYPGDSPSVVRVLDIFAFDEPVDISLP